jgi:serine/threonine protein kinase
MGSVHLVRDKVKGERLALKIMRGWLAEDDRAARRFLREIEIIKVLNHTNIVKLHDACKTQDVVFYTMEYCDRGTLADYVRQKGPLSVEEALDIACQILAALEYAHNAVFQYVRTDGEAVQAHGVIHRDLKPHNIFLADSNARLVAKVGDFGLSKALEGIEAPGPPGAAPLRHLTTEEGDWCGTPEFMSINQYRRFFEPNVAMDLWAAAATIYYMLTLLPPRGRYQYPNLRMSSIDTYLYNNITKISESALIRVPDRLARLIDDVLTHSWDCEGPISSAAEFHAALRDIVP